MLNYYYDNSYRTTLVCIDSYENKVLKGRIYNPSQPEGIAFTGAMDFLLRMENMINEANCPQAFASLRRFRAQNTEAGSHVHPVSTAMEGKLASFSLRILFRQNSSWQGSLMWHEGKAEESFRSVLELLLLMDSALAAEN